MLKNLHIQNYAIIDDLVMDFSDKFSIIIGETGAGKSILLGALSLILGKRADTKVLYDKDKKCVVEAIFDIKNYELKDLFEELDIDFDEECIIRREISPSLRSRAFINDTPVKLDDLGRISSLLIDIHRQFDNLDITRASFQMATLDAMGGNKDLLKKYRKGFVEMEKMKHELAKLKEQSAEFKREKEFRAFQLKELEAADLKENEEDELESEKKLLDNAEEIISVVSQLNGALNEGDFAIISVLQEVKSRLFKVAGANEKLGEIYNRLESASLELEDIAMECESFSDGIDYSPAKLLEIDQRLDMIYSLHRKHNVQTCEELISIRNGLFDKENNSEKLDSEILNLESNISKKESVLRKAAEVISKNRHGAKTGFETEVRKQLKELAMEHSMFEISVMTLNEIGIDGIDSVEFLFSANKGGNLEKIKDVASGGEMSRLTLVVKSLVASSIPLPTIVFDEIEMGISGEIAKKMSSILENLASKHQILSITHSPQIAAKGNIHYFVYKEIGNNRTFARVRELKGEEVVIEIAKMLSGDPPSDFALENAKELINS